MTIQTPSQTPSQDDLVLDRIDYIRRCVKGFVHGRAGVDEEEIVGEVVLWLVVKGKIEGTIYWKEIRWRIIDVIKRMIRRDGGRRMGVTWQDWNEMLVRNLVAKDEGGEDRIDVGELIDGSGLEVRERKVLWERYWKGGSLREVGGRMGLSGERVRQIERNAIGKLRERAQGSNGDG